MSEKIRLDLYLTERGLAQSRKKAQALILTNQVQVNGQTCSKASQCVSDGDSVTILGQSRFVSRGGLKLDEAMNVFPIKDIVKGAVCVDIGASTGGFSDCLLQNDAKLVYAVDVGYGQLDWKLRSDPRIVAMERKNARFMEASWFDQPIDFACMDVAFISITLILPAIYACLRDGAESVVLIKPQFEAGRDKVGKKGVVRDSSVHVEVIEKILSFSRNINFSVRGLHHSPITGPQGNIEFLLHLSKKENNDAWNFDEDEFRAKECVQKALIVHKDKHTFA